MYMFTFEFLSCHEQFTLQPLCVADMEIENKAWQVMELEKTRHHLLQENQQLKEDISSLQSQCQNLQSSTVSSSTLSTKVHPCYNSLTF